MIIDSHLIADIIKVVIAVSIFFVWIVRYPHIINEFEEYGFSHWFRDIMGIIKCIAATMLLIGSFEFTLIASSTLSILMLAAFVMHIKHSHTIVQMLPSITLAVSNLFLLYYSLA